MVKIGSGSEAALARRVPSVIVIGCASKLAQVVGADSVAVEVTGGTDAPARRTAESWTGIGWPLSATGGMTILHGCAVASRRPVLRQVATSRQLGVDVVVDDAGAPGSRRRP